MNNKGKAVGYLLVFMFALGIAFVTPVAWEKGFSWWDARNVDYNDVPLPQWALSEGVQFVTQPAEDNSLNAIVKGSIYEVNDSIGLYGACFKGNGELEPGATANLTAYHPNGSIVTDINNIAMTPVNISGSLTGEFFIELNDVDSVGTHLTKFVCRLGNQEAIAYGEWQIDPNWVVRIRNIQSSILSLNDTIQGNFSDLSGQIDGLNASNQAEFTEILNSIQAINITGETNDILNNLAELNNTVITNFTEVFNRLSNIDSNLTQIYNQVDGVSSQIDVLELNMNNSFDVVQSNFTTVFNNFDTIQGNFTQVLDAINNINVSSDIEYYYDLTKIDLDSLLLLSNEINATTYRIEEKIDALNNTVGGLRAWVIQ